MRNEPEPEGMSTKCTLLWLGKRIVSFRGSDAKFDPSHKRHVAFSSLIVRTERDDELRHLNTLIIPVNDAKMAALGPRKRVRF